MPNKTEEQSPDCRELTTQDLELIAGGDYFTGAALAVYRYIKDPCANGDYAAFVKCVMSSQY